VHRYAFDPAFFINDPFERPQRRRLGIARNENGPVSERIASIS
jgi:hypothetical protein